MRPYVDTSAAREDAAARAAARRDEAKRWTPWALYRPLAVVVLGIAGVALGLQAGSDEAGVHPNALEVGECFDEVSGATVPVGCSGPHDGEKVGEFELAPLSFDEDLVAAAAMERCRAALEVYADRPASSVPGRLVGWFPDSLPVSAERDHTVSCGVAHDAPVTGSVHRPGSNRIELAFTEPPACIDWGEPDAVTDFQVDCAGPHDSQLFYKKAMSTTSYPGAEQLAGVAERFCADAAADLPPGLAPRPVVPTPEMWEAGQRAVLCLAEPAAP